RRSGTGVGCGGPVAEVPVVACDGVVVTGAARVERGCLTDCLRGQGSERRVGRLVGRDGDARDGVDARNGSVIDERAVSEIAHHYLTSGRIPVEGTAAARRDCN